MVKVIDDCPHTFRRAELGSEKVGQHPAERAVPNGAAGGRRRPSHLRTAEARPALRHRRLLPNSGATALPRTSPQQRGAEVKQVFQ